MSRDVVVTEGKFDLELINLLAGPGLPADTVVVQAGGYSAADSLARSILVDSKSRVALVVDADAIDRSQVEQRRRVLEHSLGQAGTRDRWQVTMFTPTIEAVLFRNRSVIEAAVGHPVSDADMIRGEYEPKRILKSLLPDYPNGSLLIKRLDSTDLTALRNQPEIREIVQFLRRTGRRAA
jgi:hypothetical protein